MLLHPSVSPTPETPPTSVLEQAPLSSVSFLDLGAVLQGAWSWSQPVSWTVVPAPALPSVLAPPPHPHHSNLCLVSGPQMGALGLASLAFYP